MEDSRDWKNFKCKFDFKNDEHILQSIATRWSKDKITLFTENDSSEIKTSIVLEEDRSSKIEIEPKKEYSKLESINKINKLLDSLDLIQDIFPRQTSLKAVLCKLCDLNICMNIKKTAAELFDDNASLEQIQTIPDLACYFIRKFFNEKIVDVCKWMFEEIPFFRTTDCDEIKNEFEEQCRNIFLTHCAFNVDYNIDEGSLANIFLKKVPGNVRSTYEELLEVDVPAKQFICKNNPITRNFLKDSVITKEQNMIDKIGKEKNPEIHEYLSRMLWFKNMTKWVADEATLDFDEFWPGSSCSSMDYSNFSSFNKNNNSPHNSSFESKQNEEKSSNTYRTFPNESSHLNNKESNINEIISGNNTDNNVNNTGSCNNNEDVKKEEVTMKTEIRYSFAAPINGKKNVMTNAKDINDILDPYTQKHISRFLNDSCLTKEEDLYYLREILSCSPTIHNIKKIVSVSSSSENPTCKDNSTDENVDKNIYVDGKNLETFEKLLKKLNIRTMNNYSKEMEKKIEDIGNDEFYSEFPSPDQKENSEPNSFSAHSTFVETEKKEIQEETKEERDNFMISSSVSSMCHNLVVSFIYINKPQLYINKEEKSTKDPENCGILSNESDTSKLHSNRSTPRQVTYRHTLIKKLSHLIRAGHVFIAFQNIIIVHHNIENHLNLIKEVLGIIDVFNVDIDLNKTAFCRSDLQ